MSHPPSSADVQQQDILYEICAPHIARITLNHPETRNAQNTALLYALNDAFDRAALDDAVKVIILAAQGPHFSAGHDLKEGADDYATMVAATADFPTVGTWGGFAQPGAEGPFAREHEVYLGLCERWRNIPKPTIAQVQGKVIAGGLMLVWPCDIIVVADDAFFQDSTLNMGICGVEYFAHPQELGTRKAKEFLFTSDGIDAQEALRIGMVNRVVPRVRLEEETLAIAKRIAGKSSFALKLTKEAINAAEDARGRKTAMQIAFAYHQLLSTHWTWLTGLPANPDFLRNARGSPPGGWTPRQKPSS